MPAEDLLVLLDLTEPVVDDWRLKRRIIQRIGGIPGGDWFGGPDAQALTGKSRGWCREVLAQLDKDRVIIRYGKADHGRKIWCEVNPDWELWRGVPWRVDRHAIRRELAYVHQRRQEDAWARFTAFSGASHPRCAQLARVVGGRKRDASPNGASGGQHRGSVGAENAVTGYSESASRFESSDHPRSGGEGRGSGPQENAIVERLDALNTFLSGVLTNSLPRDEGGGGSDQQPPAPHEAPEVRKVIEAIEHASTRVYDRSSLRMEDIPRIVRLWGPDRVLAVIAEIDLPGAKAPVLVKELEHRLKTADRAQQEHAEAAADHVDRRELQELKARISAQLATFGTASAADFARHKELCISLGVSDMLPLPITIEPALVDRLDPDLEHPWAQRATSMEARARQDTQPDAD